jgi:hypothetical protein
MYDSLKKNLESCVSTISSGVQLESHSYGMSMILLNVIHGMYGKGREFEYFVLLVI